MIVFKNTIFLVIYKNCSDFDFFIYFDISKISMTLSHKLCKTIIFKCCSNYDQISAGSPSFQHACFGFDTATDNYG